MHADEDREMENGVYMVDTNSPRVLTLPTPHLYANTAESPLPDDFRNIKKVHLANSPIPKLSSH